MVVESEVRGSLVAEHCRVRNVSGHFLANYKSCWRRKGVSPFHLNTSLSNSARALDTELSPPSWPPPLPERSAKSCFAATGCPMNVPLNICPPPPRAKGRSSSCRALGGIWYTSSSIEEEPRERCVSAVVGVSIPPPASSSVSALPLLRLRPCVLLPPEALLLVSLARSGDGEERKKSRSVSKPIVCPAFP